jgi:hypothetical protein
MKPPELREAEAAAEAHFKSAIAQLRAARASMVRTLKFARQALRSNNTNINREQCARLIVDCEARLQWITPKLLRRADRGEVDRAITLLKALDSETGESHRH